MSLYPFGGAPLMMRMAPAVAEETAHGLLMSAKCARGLPLTEADGALVKQWVLAR